MQTDLFPTKVAEITLSYRSQVSVNSTKVRSSADSAEIFRKFWDDDQITFVEEFKVMLLNRAHQVIGILSPFKGGTSGVVSDPKIIFASALKAHASAIIVAHNHPSGALIPSSADMNLTRKLKQGGEYLDLPLLDHLIITADGYYSFADEGTL